MTEMDTYSVTLIDGRTLTFAEGSVVVTSWDLVACVCGGLEEEHPFSDCDWFCPDIISAEREYIDLVRSRTVPSPEAIAETIDIPLSEWPGACHAIASQMVEHGTTLGLPEGSVVTRGHWIGAIHKRSPFVGPIAQHSWITTPDGMVIDPTRYVFEGLNPYVWEGDEGDQDDYDPGSNKVRRAFSGDRPWPKIEPQDNRLVHLELDAHCRDFLRAVGAGMMSDNYFSDRQLMWIAHLDPYLSDHKILHRIWREIDRAGFRAYVPYDNADVILGPP